MVKHLVKLIGHPAKFHYNFLAYHTGYLLCAILVTAEQIKPFLRRKWALLKESGGVDGDCWCLKTFSLHPASYILAILCRVVFASMFLWQMSQIELWRQRGGRAHCRETVICFSYEGLMAWFFWIQSPTEISTKTDITRPDSIDSRMCKRYREGYTRLSIWSQECVH